MITAAAFREILAQYKSFGWQLKRLILTADTKHVLVRVNEDIFENIPVVESDLNAAWFSRPNANGRVAWELRSLGPTPFALVDSSEPDARESELIELFERVENQMRQRLIRPQGH